MQDRPRTLADKVWDAHLVRPETAETPAVLYVDLHLVHEVTSPQAFAELRERGLKVRRPDRTRRDDGPRDPDAARAERQARRSPSAPPPSRWAPSSRTAATSASRSTPWATSGRASST